MSKKWKGLIKNPILWFCFISLLGYGLLIIRAFLSHGEVFSEVFFASGYFSMSDMLMHLQFVQEPGKVYFVNEQACFPPFAYIFYFLLTRITPVSAIPDMNYYRNLPIFNLIYLIIMIIICCILMEQIRILLKDRTKYPLGIGLLVLLSEPFWGSAIERGNSVLIALVLLMGAFIFRDSTSKVLREIALIFIAMAAGFKIYPAVVGLLYIMEKRYKEALRLILYGVLVIFVPFIFFGGVSGFLQFFHNLTVIKGAEGSFYTISEMFYLLYKNFFHVANISHEIKIIGILLSFGYLLISLYVSFTTEKNWIRILLLTSLMVVFVPASYPYTTIYLLIPFMFFLREAKQTKEDCVFAVMFGFIFSIFAIPDNWFLVHFEISFCYVLRYITLYTMLLMVIARELWKEVFQIIKEDKLLNNR